MCQNGWQHCSNASTSYFLKGNLQNLKKSIMVGTVFELHLNNGQNLSAKSDHYLNNG